MQKTNNHKMKERKRTNKLTTEARQKENKQCQKDRKQLI